MNNLTKIVISTLLCLFYSFIILIILDIKIANRIKYNDPVVVTEGIHKGRTGFLKDERQNFLQFEYQVQIEENLYWISTENIRFTK